MSDSRRLGDRLLRTLWPVVALGVPLSTLLILSSATSSAAEQLVRWHGDYYMRLWDHSYDSGTPKPLLEDRNLRGGERTGALKVNLAVDADGDGSDDDSHLYFEFRLDQAFNPPNSPPFNPDGVYYHDDLPSARFYGGMSADFYNLQTRNFRQAFVENDGAGGDVLDVGYPSPYGAPEYQGLRDYNARARHADGRYSKWHLGPHEDIAVAVFDPAFPYALDADDDPTDNAASFHAAFVWKKADFLAGGADAQVRLDADARFSFESTRWWDNVDEVRWLIQDDDGQLYISRFSVPGAHDYYGHINELVNPLGTQWALYQPAVDDLDFDQDAGDLLWLDPLAEGLFTDVQAFGLYLENDLPSTEIIDFSLDEIRFSATVVAPSPWTADFNADLKVDAADLQIWEDAFGDSDADGSDWLAWQQEYGGVSGAAATHGVPETCAFALVATATLGWLACRSTHVGRSLRD